MLSALGWRLEGRWPDLRRMVVVLAPHTSNWDFFLAICVVVALGVRAHWIGKHTLFRWPFGRLMRYLGGTPIVRDASIGRVAQIVEQIKRSDEFILGVAPEGTRRRAPRWKSGFYHVAVGAGVPILLAYLDYSQRVVGLGPVFHPTGDERSDLASIRSFYDKRWARFPDQV